jgi:hypothetical protein
VVNLAQIWRDIIIVIFLFFIVFKIRKIWVCEVMLRAGSQRTVQTNLVRKKFGEKIWEIFEI